MRLLLAIFYAFVTSYIVMRLLLAILVCVCY